MANGAARIGPTNATAVMDVGAHADARPRHHGNRFGRSEEARTAVMEAVDELLVERGFAALTIDAVAARAGVGKQTIYRWWTSKTDLLFDAFIDETEEELETIDRGTLEADLRAHATQLVAFFSRDSNAAMFRAIAGQAQHDEKAAARFRAEIVAEQRARDRRPFENARMRGLLPDGLDVDDAVEAWTAPIYYRLLLTGAALDQALVDQLIDACLERVGSPRHARRFPDGGSGPDDGSRSKED